MLLSSLRTKWFLIEACIFWSSMLNVPNVAGTSVTTKPVVRGNIRKLGERAPAASSGPEDEEVEEDIASVVCNMSADEGSEEILQGHPAAC